MAKSKRQLVSDAPKEEQQAPAPAIHNTDTVEIGPKTITVKELSVRDIINLVNDKNLLGSASSKDGFELDALREEAEKYLPKFISGANMDDLLDMKPSELRRIYDKFMEINKTFFAVARTVGLDQIVAQLKLALQRDFLRLLADL
jgi:hypothetical protein